MNVVGICRFSLVGRGDWKAYRYKGNDEVEAIAMKQAEILFRPERMEARLSSFEHLTLASIKAQTDTDFHFIVLASEMMPTSYRQRLEKLCANVPQVTLRFFGIIDTAFAQWQVYDELNFTLGDTIQFRLDDDDCVCADFVEKLKTTSEPMLASDEPFAISLDSTLYCARSEVGSEIYYWPKRFFSAGVALKHDRKSIFNVGHFSLGERFRSDVISNGMALATNNGKNDTNFTYDFVRQHGLIRIYDGDIANKVASHFSFLSEKAKVLTGLSEHLATTGNPKSSQPKTHPIPAWLNDFVVPKFHRGFFISGDNFALQHTHRDSNILYVGFDDIAKVRIRSRAREGWGYNFARTEGWSYLGVMTFAENWFRDTDLHEALETLSSQGFFKNFEKVVFSGVSMGGYGACAFAPLAPGCTVIAFSPQSTLAANLAAWDSRYRKGSAADWSGKFVDGAEGVRDASQAWIIYDPKLDPDHRHAMRIAGENVTYLRARHTSHYTAFLLKENNILQEISRCCADGSMTESKFYNRYRSVLKDRRILRRLVDSVIDRGGVGLQCYLLEVLRKRERWGMVRILRTALEQHPDKVR